MSAREDAGLRAVARVRRQREQDSRVGLRQAFDEQLSRETDALVVRDRLARGTGREVTDPAAFTAHRAALLHLGAELAASERALGGARLLTAVAQERWHQERGRLRAVEMLLERRADARRAEAARREAAELDDIAAQRWLRQGGGA